MSVRFGVKAAIVVMRSNVHEAYSRTFTAFL
jgi:hypothetical protein